MRRSSAMSSTRATSALPVRARGQILLLHAAAGRDPVGDIARQPRIFSGAEGAARALEIGVGAELPEPADDAERRRAVVEAQIVEIRDHLVLDQHLPAA